MNTAFVLRVTSPVLSRQIRETMASEQHSPASHVTAMKQVWERQDPPFLPEQISSSRPVLSFQQLSSSSVSSNPSPSTSLSASISYKKDDTSPDPSHYLFRFGSDMYYATRYPLATKCEVMTSTDQGVTTSKQQDIQDVLVVHDVRMTPESTRPLVSHVPGLTPPMARADEVFASMHHTHTHPSKEEIRREEATLASHIRVYQDAQKHARKPTPSTSNPSSSTTQPLVQTVYREEAKLVEMDEWVMHLPPTFRIQEGNDQFVSSLSGLFQEVQVCLSREKKRKARAASLSSGF